jgi:hypothetical protein
MINELRKSETRPDAEITFLPNHTFLYKIGSWQNFAMTSPENSHMKSITNELSFPLVTHMTHFDIWFGRYSILKSYFSFRHVMDRFDCSCSVTFLGHILKEIESAFRRLLKHTFQITVATVEAIKHSHVRSSPVAEILLRGVLRAWLGSR